MKESQAIEPGQSLETAALEAESPEAAPESRNARVDSLEVSSEEISVGPYSDAADDEDDVVTLQMDAPLDDDEWMVQTSALERRCLSTEQLAAARMSGALPPTTRVWRNGMRAWTPLAEVDLGAPLAAAILPAAEATAKEDVVPSARPVVPPLAAPPPKRAVPAVAAPPVPAVASRPVPAVASRPVPSQVGSPALLSPPPPRIAPPPSRPVSAAPAALPSRALPGLSFGSSASATAVTSPSSRALGSSPGSALGSGASLGFGASLGSGASLGFGARSPALSPPPPRLEARRPDPGRAVLPGFEEPAPARRVDTATSVALDLGPVASKRSGRWGALFAQGAAAVVALLGTSYALTRAGVFEPGAASAGGGAVTATSTSMLSLRPAQVASGMPSSAAVALAASAESTAEPAAVSEAMGASSASALAAEPARAVPEAARAGESAAVAPTPANPLAAQASTTPAATNSEPPPAAAAPAPSEPAAKAVSESESTSADPGSRRAKRAARRAAALEARRAHRAVAQGSRAEPEQAEAATPPREPGSTFDRAAAQAALVAAAEQAKNCRPIGGPSGSGMVLVQYEPSGKVSTVSIVTPGFENSDAAGCIQMLFRRARVQAFNGTKGALMRQRFEIP